MAARVAATQPVEPLTGGGVGLERHPARVENADVGGLVLGDHLAAEARERAGEVGHLRVIDLAAEGAERDPERCPGRCPGRCRHRSVLGAVAPARGMRVIMATVSPGGGVEVPGTCQEQGRREGGGSARRKHPGSEVHRLCPRGRGADRSRRRPARPRVRSPPPWAGPDRSPAGPEASARPPRRRGRASPPAAPPGAPQVAHRLDRGDPARWASSAAWRAISPQCRTRAAARSGSGRLTLRSATIGRITAAPDLGEGGDHLIHLADRARARPRGGAAAHPMPAGTRRSTPVTRSGSTERTRTAVLLIGVVDDHDQLPGAGAQRPGEMAGGLTADDQGAIADLLPGDEEAWHRPMVARPRRLRPARGGPAAPAAASSRRRPPADARPVRVTYDPVP